ncbi:hypothetical protein HDE_10858 [Halotydeus destructor]|nr:hypothetical protein HDE_10858 [Halotydeus destructor]
MQGPVGRRCKVEYDCDSGEICDYRPNTLKLDSRCYPTKGLTEVCTTDRQCQDRVAKSRCSGSLYFDGTKKSWETNFRCSCDVRFKNIGGSCVDEDYCLSTSDCSDGVLFTMCRQNKCQRRFYFSSDVFIKVAIVYSILVFLYVYVIFCAKRKTNQAEEVPPEGMIGSSHTPPITIPQDGAVISGSVATESNSSPSSKLEAEPPRYSVVIAFKEDYPEVMYQPPSYQDIS